MSKIPFRPNSTYLIRNTGNNFEPLFYERRNYDYFVRLLQKHLSPVAHLETYRLHTNGFELLVRFFPEDVIPPKIQDALHRPLANFFIAYTKTINKHYGRSGSLFRESLQRILLNEQQFLTMKSVLEAVSIHPGNLNADTTG